MTKQMEHPVRHRLRRCEGCVNAFVDPNEVDEFCASCVAAGRARPSLGLVGGDLAPANETPSRPSAEPPPIHIVREHPPELGLPGKIAWTTPPFRVGWDEGAYLNESEDARPARSFPSENVPAKNRRRTLLALVAAVSVLMLISRLDAPDFEMAWRDLTKPKPAVERRILPPAPQIGKEKPKIAN